jgi:hypothetical protein
VDSYLVVSLSNDRLDENLELGEKIKEYSNIQRSSSKATNEMG